MQAFPLQHGSPRVFVDLVMHIHNGFHGILFGGFVSPQESVEELLRRGVLPVGASTACFGDG